MNMREHLFKLPAGEIVTAIIANTETGKDELSFYLKESDFIIRQLDNQPVMKIKAGVVSDDKVSAAAIMFKFDKLDYIYDCWFNGRSSYGEEALSLLTQQENTLLHIVNINGKLVSQFRIENKLRGLCNAYFNIIRRSPLWSEDDYYNLRKQTYLDFNYDYEYMWNELLK